MAFRKHTKILPVFFLVTLGACKLIVGLDEGDFPDDDADVIIDSEIPETGDFPDDVEVEADVPPYCENNGDCDDGHGCTEDRCELATHTCQYFILFAGEICRPSAGDCDIEEYCDGENEDCPEDTFESSDTVCRPSGGICDVEESCTGSDPVCPEDAFMPAGSPCYDGDPCTYPGECDGAGMCVNTPVSRLHHVVQVTGGYYHTCVLLQMGEVMCWGYNLSGQLGDGTTENRYYPVYVAGLPSAAVAVTAGGSMWEGSHTCAILNSGNVMCWGDNTFGQLGDGTTSTSHEPVEVVGLPSAAVVISTGLGFTCALLDTGGAKCWGSNSYGKLGNNRWQDSSMPVQVFGLTSGVTDIAAGGNHACAVVEGGVKCWGYNGEGQLGDDSTRDRRVPVDVYGLDAGVLAVTTGLEHSCGLLATGGIQCWGDNNYGQLGNGSLVNRKTPDDVVGLSTGVQAVSAAFQHTCALTTAGGAKCWGNNNRGQLGDGTTTWRSRPVDVTGLTSGAGAIAMGYRSAHNCAIMGDTSIVCWGSNFYGQLGDGTIVNKSEPVDVLCGE